MVSDISELVIVEAAKIDDTELVRFCEGIWETAFPAPPAETATPVAVQTDEDFAQQMLAGFNPVDTELSIAFPDSDAIYDPAAEYIF